MRKLLCIVLVLFVAFTCCSCSFLKGYGITEKETFALDTIIDLKIYGDYRMGSGNLAINESIEEIRRYENLLSATIDGSDIYRINQSGGQPIKVSDETADIIRIALSISEKTDGAFDISMYELTKLWGFNTKEYYVPTDSEIAEALKKTGYQNITITDDNYVTVKNGATVDLGGIAKGYIADVAEMKIHNTPGSIIKGSLINFGGMIMTEGENSDSKDKLFNIGVEHPDENKGYFATFKCNGEDVVTSGAYQRYFEKDGVRYHHIIDPKNGRPSDSDILSVTVVSDNAFEADAMSTAFFVMGVSDTLDYIKQNKMIDGSSFEIIVLDKNNNLYVTKGVHNKDFKLEPDFEGEIKIKVIDSK